MKWFGRNSLSAIALCLFVSSGVNLSLSQAQEGKIVPYVPTPQAVVDRMLELAQVKKGDVVYDLGSATVGSSSPRRKSTASRRSVSKSIRNGSKNRMKISKRPGSKTWSRSASKISVPSTYRRHRC